MSIKLSILIPTLPNRLELFYLPLIKNLIKQIEPYKDIELISLFDNKKRTIGKKRQNMIDIIQGEYVCFIDDDDRISDDYVKLIMNSLYNNPLTDCVVFWSCINQPDMEDKIVKFGLENGSTPPCHVHVWKSSIVKKYEYKNINHGEDSDWLLRAKNDIEHLSKIDKILYYYDARYNTLSETCNLSDEIIKNNINKLLNKETIVNDNNNLKIIIDKNTNLFDIQNKINETNKKIYLRIDKKSFNNNLKQIGTFVKCMKNGYFYGNSSIKINNIPEIIFF